MKKKCIVYILLLFAYISQAQPTVGIKTPANAETGYMGGTFNHAEIIDFAMLGAIDEFTHQADSLYKSAAPGLEHVSKYFISSSSFIIVFLPAKSGKNDDVPELPDYPHKNAISYRNLEFSVSQNNSIIQDWKPISSLQKEKEYPIMYINESKKNSLTWPSLLAGKYQLTIGDKLLLKIRRNGKDKVLQNIYIERVRVTPSINSIHQFPAGTSIQDILNKEMVREDSLLVNDDELELNPGNSVLLSFERDISGSRIIDYTFSEDLTGWKPLQSPKDDIPTISPYFIYVDKPGETNTKNLYLRYRHQPESIRHIKIIVKPKLTQTTWFRIAASLVLAFLLFITGYYFNRKKNKKRLRQLTLKRQEIESKLQLLGGQLNPHFLFNSLNSIQNLINKEEGEDASKYLSKVSAFLRTVMDAGKKEYISLEEELKIAEDYLQLEQKRRFFRYDINNSSGINLSQVDFPPLLLQPILENCIHHGFAKDIADPALRIEISGTGDNINVTVSDNGKGFDPAIAERGQGISLVEKRISIMNEKMNSNNIQMALSSDKNGTTTTFTFKNWK